MGVQDDGTKAVGRERWLSLRRFEQFSGEAKVRRRGHEERKL